MQSASIYFSIINIKSGFVRINYYRNKDTFKLTPKLTPTIIPVTPTGTKSPEEVDGTKKVPAAEAAAVAMTIVETTQSLNICLKGK